MIEFLQTKVYLSFILFVLVWMLSPGSGHLLMLSNGTKYGMPQAMLTALGDVSVNVLQMVIAALGVGALIVAIPWGLQLLKWLGIGYLSYMAFDNFRSYYQNKIKKFKLTKQSKNSNLFMQGVIVTITNAKAIIFFSVAFPSFLVSELPIVPQLVVLGICFVLVDMFYLTSYGLLGYYGFSRLASKNQSFVDGFAGIMLLLAVVLLIFKDIS